MGPAHPGAQGGLSSGTVAEPEDLSRFLVPQPEGGMRRADLVVADGGAEPDVTMLPPGEDLPPLQRIGSHRRHQM